MVTGKSCGIRLRHALGCAGELWRMSLVNKIVAQAVSRSLDLPRSQVRGAIRLLQSLPRLPSPERLALVVQRDYGLDDDDVGEMFGRSGQWSAWVRSQAAELRASEPIDERLEWLEEGLQPDHPTPREIQARALAIRLSRRPERVVAFPMGATAFTWSRSLNAFLPVCA